MRRLATLAACSALALLALAPAAQAEGTEFGLESFSAGFLNGDGTGIHAIFGNGATADTRAGGHPFLQQTNFDFTTIVPPAGGTFPSGNLKDVVVKLPAGFTGNPLATPGPGKPRCSLSALETSGCPLDTAVGVVHVPVAASSSPNPSGTSGPNLIFNLPVHNMEPVYGEPALLGFLIPFPQILVLLHFHLDPQRNYALTATISNVSTAGTAYSSNLAVWGVPADPVHDPWRGSSGAPYISASNNGCLDDTPPGFNIDGAPSSTGLCPSDAQPPKPFLIDPTSCEGPVKTTISVDSWQEQGALDAEGEPDLADPNWKTYTEEGPAMSGCNQLDFSPTIEARPTTNVADAPSGLDFHLHIPQNEDPEGLAEAELRDAVVTLPEGMALNPGAADGLAACTPAQIGLVTAVGQTPVRFNGTRPNCPDASKIGSLRLDSPLIEHPLAGSVYLASQERNPFGSLVAIYAVIDDPETGILIKLAGRVELDPKTGRLTTSFAENAQQPFGDFRLHFFGGARGTLRTPLTCGQFKTSSSLTPWSAPESGPPATPSDSFAIATGPGGGPCLTSAATAPHSPAFSAGTESPAAGAFSPFLLKFTRPDGSQELTAINETLPPGLSGRLAGIPYCPEAAIAAAAARSHPGEGALEKASPSCPAASEVGTVNVGAGAGPNPVYAQGHAYLAGPYKGAPLSLAVVTPAVAGPFDLGTVVVRNPLFVDPSTARITVKSDPIPTALAGIPLDIRSIAVRIDRDRFTLNPTSCDPMEIGAEALSALGQTASLSTRFQVGGCAALGFKPRLQMRLFGGTNRGAHPRFRAILTPRPGDANIASVSVALPHSEFLDQGHIHTICTRVQFAANQCPADSIYGRARALSPLLDHPLEGPVYLRSSSNKLPDLVAALRGPDSQPIEVEVAGRIDSIHGGLRSTFETVPDQPVTKFILTMQGGKKGLLVNSTGICRATHRATVKMDGQNGKAHDFRPPLRAKCKHKQRKKHRGHHKKSAGRHRHGGQ